MNRHKPRTGTRAAVLGALALTAVAVCAQPQAPVTGFSVRSDVGISQRLNAIIPLDTRFRDESGRTVALGDYFGSKPVVMALIYYKCPMLCNQVLNGLLGAVRMVKFDAGREYEIVLVGIDPREGPEVAAKKKDSYVRSYGRPGAESGWHFLTGEEASIRRVAKAVGYRYKLDPRTNLYVHGAGIMVLTPNGKLSQYFYGIEYSPRDLRWALVQSSKNRIGNLVDKFLLYCYLYDPTTGKYGLVIMSVLRLAALATVLSLGGFIFVMVRRERSRVAKRAMSNGDPHSEPQDRGRGGR